MTLIRMIRACYHLQLVYNFSYENIGRMHIWRSRFMGRWERTRASIINRKLRN